MEILSCLVVAAALEAPAVRSRVSNPGARELERGATAGNAFPGLSADLPVPLAAGAMPPSRTVDIKLSFPQFNGEPGPDCRRFRRDLIQCGGQTDTHGASIADCLLREDEGAVQYGTGIPGVPAVAVPGVQAIAAGNAGRSARQRHEARLKQSATYLLLHLDNDF